MIIDPIVLQNALLENNNVNVNFSIQKGTDGKISVRANLNVNNNLAMPGVPGGNSNFSLNEEVAVGEYDTAKLKNALSVEKFIIL